MADMSISDTQIIVDCYSVSNYIIMCIYVQEDCYIETIKNTTWHNYQ